MINPSLFQMVCYLTHLVTPADRAALIVCHDDISIRYCSVSSAPDARGHYTVICIRANFGLMFAQCRRRWGNIKDPVLAQCMVRYCHNQLGNEAAANIVWFNPLNPHDALKHHFTSLKTDFIFLQQMAWNENFHGNGYQYMAIFFNFQTT